MRLGLSELPQSISLQPSQLLTNTKTFGKNESFTLKYEAACSAKLVICQTSRVSFTRLISTVTLVTIVKARSAYSVIVIVKIAGRLKLASGYHLLVYGRLLGS